MPYHILKDSDMVKITRNHTEGNFIACQRLYRCNLLSIIYSIIEEVVYVRESNEKFDPTDPLTGA